MKLGFICPNVPGHLNPMTALARQLQSRNHDVVFLYSSGGAGLPFVPADEQDHINENRPAVSKMQGEDALQFSVRMVMAQTEMILKSLPATVMATGVDALLIDTVQFYESGFPMVPINRRATYLRFNGNHNEWSGGCFSHHCSGPLEA